MHARTFGHMNERTHTRTWHMLITRMVVSNNNNYYYYYYYYISLDLRKDKRMKSYMSVLGIMSVIS